MLCVIDNFSKMAFLRALKNKTAKLVSNALEDIFVKSGRIPKKIHHDAGGEFESHTFRKLLEKYHVIGYKTFSEIKVGIIER